jgi:DNA excision repair protein ERCC-4
MIKSYTSIEGDEPLLLLQDIRPRYIVFYDADISFVRSVETYSALSCAADSVRVYLLLFEASAEEKKFMLALQREQTAFEKLINHKQTMPDPAIQVTATQEMQQAIYTGSVGGSYNDGKYPLAFDSRSGGDDSRRGKGKFNTSKERRDIAVDVREFRSSLPNILHQGGMRIAPVTLIVGDFVLSNVHCIERKSISDLFGSFASGRLFMQAEAMCKHYKCPCLLIEFDLEKSFCLQSVNDIGPNIKADSVCSKITLLTMHFPKLRILWSRGPYQTLKIFQALKVNHDEVDVERAMEIGRADSAETFFATDGDATDGETDEINEVARDMLLRLPGVNVHSARKIMQECDSLAELAEMSRDELRRIAGPVTGQKLFTFFRQNIDSS